MVNSQNTEQEDNNNNLTKLPSLPHIPDGQKTPSTNSYRASRHFDRISRALPVGYVRVSNHIMTLSQARLHDAAQIIVTNCTQIVMQEQLIRQILTSVPNPIFHAAKGVAQIGSVYSMLLRSVTFVQIVRFTVYTTWNLTSQRMRGIIGSVSWRDDASGKSQPNTMRLPMAGVTYATHMRLQPAGNTRTTRMRL